MTIQAANLEKILKECCISVCDVRNNSYQLAKELTEYFIHHQFDEWVDIQEDLLNGYDDCCCKEIINKSLNLSNDLQKKDYYRRFSQEINQAIIKYLSSSTISSFGSIYIKIKQIFNKCFDEPVIVDKIIELIKKIIKDEEYDDLETIIDDVDVDDIGDSGIISHVLDNIDVSQKDKNIISQGIKLIFQDKIDQFLQLSSFNHFNTNKSLNYLYTPNSQQISIIKITDILTNKLKLKYSNASNAIARCFKQIANQNKLTRLKDLRNDLKYQHSSIIMRELLNRYPNISNHIFDVVKKIAFSYHLFAPLELRCFKFKHDASTAKEVTEICAKELTGMFIHSTPVDTHDNHGSLIVFKSWDFENKYPLLMCMVDTFSRYRAEEDQYYWNNNADGKLTPLSKVRDNHQKADVLLSEWFNKCDIVNKLINNSNSNLNKQKIEETLKIGINLIFSRLYQKILYNYRCAPTIYDSYDIFTRYTCAFNSFIYNISAGPNSKDWKHLPIQFDFWIIPRLCKNRIYFQSDDDDDDDDVDVDEKDVEDCLTNGDNSQAIWNISKHLQQYHYIENQDYFIESITIKDREYIPRLVHKIQQLWDKYPNARNQRYRRYIIIIDRRNPKHISNKMMKNDVNTIKIPTWNDTIYIILPKQHNTISLNYAYKLNECFAENTLHYLLPIKIDQLEDHFGGLAPGNGYKFVLSYHVYEKNKTKIYWYWSNGAQRFFMDDITWLWPRYFKKQTYNSFQSLTVDTEYQLQQSTKKMLQDKQFDEFREYIA